MAIQDNPFDTNLIYPAAGCVKSKHVYIYKQGCLFAVLINNILMINRSYYPRSGYTNNYYINSTYSSNTS